jgi:catechol 2,3-dioxygenase-like lactoylglutathione lyase family enzyme
VRIWDLDPGILCRRHLLGEHREVHAVWAILTGDRAGYRRHPETRRWEGRLAALAARHDALAAEMARRGYAHRSPLDRRLATGAAVQTAFVDPPGRQRDLLAAKPCPCPLDARPPALGDPRRYGSRVRVTGFDHVNVRVADADRSLAFYRGLLGLEPERLDAFRRGETSLLTFRVSPTAILHLVPTDGFRAPPAEQLDAAWNHLCLNVDGPMEPLMAELTAAGVTIDREPFDAYGALGLGRAVYVRDPDGYRVELKTAS